VNEQQSIRTLAERGWSRGRIARELGLHRETVGRYLGPASAMTGAVTADGTTMLQVTGVAGRRYGIEGSPNLRDWISLGTVTAAGIPVHFRNPEASARLRWFYRSVERPRGAQP
jgi:hypothetical protein